MIDDGWQNARHLNLYLKTRTRYLTAETWDPKVFLPPANYPVSGFPFELLRFALGRVGTASRHRAAEGRPKVGAWLRRALRQRSAR
jgi:hypothetical protein